MSSCRAVSLHRATGADRITLRAWRPRRLAALALLTIATSASAQTSQSPAAAQPPSQMQAQEASDPWRTDRFYLETSLHTRHFHYDPAHDDTQRLILGEWNITEQWLLGASFFDNSFGQPTQYVYGGWRYRPFEQARPFYVKVSAGLVHGYKNPYRDKIPFNHSGIAPAIIPSIGVCFSRICSELVIVGGAGLILTLGVTIP